MALRTSLIAFLTPLAGLAMTAGCGSLPPETAGGPAGGDQSPPDGSVDDELIVTTVPGADPVDLADLYTEQGATVRDRLADLSVALLGVEPTRLEEVRNTLEASPLIENVDDNQLIDLETIPDDPDYALQWHLDAIQAPAAWAISTGSADILVAVLDTGVDTEHPDLASKLQSGGNTYDGISGWNDFDGHGTAVAGVIGAATDNGEGVASLARDCPIMPIRVTDSRSQATSWALAAGISLAVEAGARVINISYSPSHHDDVLLREAQFASLAGALVVFSAGNTGEKIAGGGSGYALWVGAAAANGDLAGFATYGDFVDLVAPGVTIYTTKPGGAYGTSTGASFAAPIVSGVAALIWSLNPDLRPTTVQGILLTTATDLGPEGDDERFGAGLVNARAAVDLARAIVEPPDETPPSVTIAQPGGNSAVSGLITVTVQVSDGTDLADVILAVDGMRLASDAIAPYTFVVDSTDYSLGGHVVSATATDLSGNSAEHRIDLTFTDPGDKTVPTVEVSSPAEGSMVRGIITILADASDDRMLLRAEVLLDDQLLDTIVLGRAQTKIAYNWNASAPEVAPGLHTITVRVFDTSENTSSATVNVNVGS